MNNSIILRRDDFLEKEGQLWMTAHELGRHLGFTNPFRGVKKIYYRNQAELEPFKGVSQIGTPLGGKQEHLAFNEIGCYIIAMLAKTEKARKFRRALAEFLQKIRVGEIEIRKKNLELTQVNAMQEAFLRRRAVDLFVRTSGIGVRRSQFILNLQGKLTPASLSMAFGVKEKHIEKLFFLDNLRRNAWKEYSSIPRSL